jgi:hypothetical protein
MDGRLGNIPWLEDNHVAAPEDGRTPVWPHPLATAGNFGVRDEPGVVECWFDFLFSGKMEPAYAGLLRINAIKKPRIASGLVLVEKQPICDDGTTTVKVHPNRPEQTSQAPESAVHTTSCH